MDLRAPGSALSHVFKVMQGEAQAPSPVLDPGIILQGEARVANGQLLTEESLQC